VEGQKSSHSNDEEDHDGEDAQRGTKYREYIKEKLLSHPIWQDGIYWEQALWKCTIEQVNLTFCVTSINLRQRVRPTVADHSI